MGTAVAWGILGTGKIARIVAGALEASDSGELRALGSRTEDRALAFAAELGVPRAYGSYAAVLDDPDVELAYVATHHPAHREWAVRAAEAGKHVLCEKPIAMDAEGAEAIVAAARSSNVFL